MTISTLQNQPSQLGLRRQIRAAGLLLTTLSFAISQALASEPARLAVVLFAQGEPVANARILLDGKTVGRTNEDGAIEITTTAGKHDFVLRLNDAALLQLDLNLIDGERAELIANKAENGETTYQIESSNRAATNTNPTNAKPTNASDVALQAPGYLLGKIINGDDGKPVVGAKIYISGTPLEITTDTSGSFRVELPAGDYSLSVLAAQFSARTLDGIKVLAKETLDRTIELTPAGVELPEFVVLEPYLEGSLAAFVEEKKSASFVADILGAEQISRSGDSDAAGALKRVTGLTLVDGKYVYVRGLGERYSSVLLNGAQIPSPDPTRRVVPLDLFPTEILEGILIQKTFSADMPGEFGGGTVQLRTKGIPEDFFYKVSATMGYADGTSFEQGLRYQGSNRDWTGFDDGARELPASIANATANNNTLRPQTPFNPDGLTPQEFELIGESLAGVYDINKKQLGPNTGITASVGNVFELDESRLGFLASLRYAQNWDNREEIRRRYQVIGDNELDLSAELQREKTAREVELSGFLNLGWELGEQHQFKNTTVLVRQSSDEAQISEGYTEDPEDISRFYELEWIENELFSTQLAGEHQFDWTQAIDFDWQFTYANASREAPNQRDYRFDRNNNSGEFEFSRRSDSNGTVFEFLDDQSNELKLKASTPFEIGEFGKLELAAGAQLLQRDRDSSLRRFSFSAVGPLANNLELYRLGSLERIFNPTNIGPDGFQLSEGTRGTDNYIAEQNLDAYFVSAQWNWKDRWSSTIGARLEDNQQSVSTFAVGTANQQPVVAELAAKDILPSLALTFKQSEKSQYRFGYSETLSRPDFRELSEAPFNDPQLDIETIGNPNLQVASITNYDFRWEYYFSDAESLSVAAFLKDFVDPIEKIQVPGTGELQSLANAAKATNFGVEFDIYKQLGWITPKLQDAYVSANYAWIESEIDLGGSNDIQTNEIRPLQGQSPYVLNFQLGWLDPKDRFEASLSFNRFGERISQVGVFGAPDIYEQPFNQLDAVFKYSWKNSWSLRARLKNLLDSEVLFTQGGLSTREFKRGRELSLTLEYKP